MAYLTRETVRSALGDLFGTADHLLKIWVVLKQMGLTPSTSVTITTSSSQPALRRLFSFGHPEGDFFIPFSHTPRFMTMKSDADRSIVQTNIRRWATSGSVVTVDPTSYLDISEERDGTLIVRTGRSYPLGLGYGKNGFALEDDARVSIPMAAFAVWYYRQEDLPQNASSPHDLRQALCRDLALSPAEQELVFSSEDPTWRIGLRATPLSDAELFSLVNEFLTGNRPAKLLDRMPFLAYSTRVASMATIPSGPSWLAYDPAIRLQNLVAAGSKAILLYGPPRTGKTRAIDLLVPRNSTSRATIQIHPGWGYDELIVGLRPDKGATWSYQEGPFLAAIHANKEHIVLEEINRTEFTQAIGEVFSLIEMAYRGEENAILLRNGNSFFIPAHTSIYLTMNTLDRTTEDDALLARVDAVEFPPRVEDLHTMLRDGGCERERAEKLRSLFAFVQQYYPLGHGYFAGVGQATSITAHYLSKIRPVLQKHMKDIRDEQLAAIDEKVDELFGQP